MVLKETAPNSTLCLKATPKPKLNEAQFNCSDCFFQGTNNDKLTKHISLKHTIQPCMENIMKCKNCGEQFNNKRNLMYHRKSKHINSVAYCRNKLEGNCSYEDNMCWWNHAEKKILHAIFVMKFLKQA